ncbi:uncharacterized protein METZ01_LOCUS341169 [marine metagenome]|uniref:Outer membrane protein beta-barrel domain-containing protein n=1 Tax=marine metagenome TaxID=408172 RepID=A0A382QTY3_9ZZZZ
MNKIFTTILIAMLPASISAIGGLGLQLGQGMVTVGAMESNKNLLVGETVVSTATMTTTEFSNPYVIGGYIYIDAIPFIDLEADINIVGQKYDFGFNNPIAIGPYEFGWASSSAYLTIRKTAFKLGIPILAKAKLFYGGGYNQHMVTPLMTIDLMEEMMGGDLGADPTNISEEDLIEFLDENKIESSGIHVQAGLQFKVLMLDSFLFYRHTFAKDLVPDADAFGSINLRLGFGI